MKDTIEELRCKLRSIFDPYGEQTIVYSFSPRLAAGKTRVG
ncbi:MAG: hypothetical protein NTW71_10670 [Deltaproteobacteria bacterium]|nr:hypothetical protein [Deltaproteobacteria bacterium]